MEQESEFNLPAKYMDSVCRVCLTEQKLLISMYEIHLTHNLNPQGTIASVPLTAVFQKYCNVKISFFDHKPQKICVSCMNAVCTAYNFFELFLQSNALLEKILPSQKVVLPQKFILPKKPTKNRNAIHILPNGKKISVRKNTKRTVGPSLVDYPELITVSSVDSNGVTYVISQNNESLEVISPGNAEDDVLDIIESDPLQIVDGSQNLDKEVALVMENVQATIDLVKKEKKTNESRRIKTPPYFLNDPTGSLRDHNYLMSEKYFRNLERKRFRKKFGKIPKTEKSILPRPNYQLRQRQKSQQLYDKDIFNCKFCRITFHGIDKVLEHVKEKHADSKRCILCPAPVKRLLMYHVAAHSKNGLVCRICRFYFEDKESLLSHKTEFDHNDMLTCQICGKKFKSMSKRRSHNDVHKDKDKVGQQCSQCGLVIKYGSNLARHERSHLTMNERKRFLCQICASSYTTKYALDLHVKCVHEGQTELKEKLRKYYKFHRIKHQEKVRKNQKSGKQADDKSPGDEYTCEYCPRKFANKHNYSTHVMSHPEHKDISCPWCPLIFDSVQSYRAHQELQHRSFRCDVCKKGFASESLLKAHMKTHSDGFQCESCSRLFTTMMSLVVHRRIHTGEKPYRCERCDKAFKQPSQLTHHIQCMHTSKNHKCKICGKAFNFPYGLQAHMRTHTGEKPFACLYCDKRYRDTVSRHKHVKRDHPEKLENFMEYKKSFQWEESKEVRIKLDGA